MKTTIQYRAENYIIDLAQPLDISLPLEAGGTLNCFYAPPLVIEPVRADNFVGDTLEGGLLNFKNVQINPHGNGTHTECVGHISKGGETINQTLTQFFFLAQVVSIQPEIQENGDGVIMRDQLVDVLEATNATALVIRTLPNNHAKRSKNYSGSNPAYLHHMATKLIVEKGIEHLLIDLPSVDREEDDGLLLSHKAFWQYPGEAVRTQATITELIYVPDTVTDGFYFLNIQITSLELDASPSKPVLYKVVGG